VLERVIEPASRLSTPARSECQGRRSRRMRRWQAAIG